MASIRKRGKSYQITVSNGRDIHDKQILETATWTPDPNKTEKQNQKALERFAMDFEDRVKSGKYLKGEKMTFQEYSALWLSEYAEKQMERTSIERCESSLDNIILPAIGHLKLSEIQPLHLTRLYSALAENGYVQNGKKKPYSARTIKRIHQIISSSLNTAVYWQLIESNPCQRVKPPKVEKQADVRHFTLGQTQAFLSQLDTPYTVAHWGRARRDGTGSRKHYEEKEIPLQFKALFHLAIFGGFRRGELVALTWDDIDFQNHTVTINKASARTKDGIITKAPKTFSSNRTVTLPPGTMGILQKHQAEQQEYRQSLGTYWKGSNYLFIQDDGRQMDISTPNKVFQKVIRRYNETHGDKLPEITLHGLRHTSATLLIAQNVDVKTVSNRLGHSEASTTMDIYAHALKKQDKLAAESLGELFTSQTKAQC
ncbi:MAG: site-specific integrase [Lachnospiraceae bacterium]|nr:site-specific integrase [Lachnospiraceae bacterium]